MGRFFEGVYFAIIQGPGFDGDESDYVIGKLVENGGRQLQLTSSVTELHQITHIISTHVDFPAYNDALEGLINVVTPKWVLDSLEKKKAATTRPYSPDPRYFFSGVNLVCADDIPPSDKDAILGGVIAMGGQYSSAMSKLVTHVVALSINPPQCQTIVNKKLDCKPVLPHWFDACLRLGRKIDCAPYIIPSTGEQPLLYQNTEGDIASPPPPEFDGTISLTPSEGHFIQSGTDPKSQRRLTVFAKKRLMLHEDLNLSDRLSASLSKIISSGGGSVVENLVECNTLICQNRSSKQFREAYRAGKDVGNLNWLYHLIQRDRWTAPTDRLLHFPYPENGIPGFKDLVISVSNHSGEARLYLESLVVAAGGVFTKTLSQGNTHLITAHLNSEKCDAAREWNIHIINHIWLEESFSRGELASVTIPRYTTFPERTNLGEIVGQEHIDRDKLAEQLGFSRIVAASPQSSPCTEGREEPVEEDDIGPSHQTPVASSGKKRQTVRTPGERNPFNMETPKSRVAKNRAAIKLHEMASDIALFEKETKRVGGVIYGGRKVTDPERVSVDRPRQVSHKRSFSDANSNDETFSADDDEEEGQSSGKTQKRAKTTKNETSSKEPILEVLITGVEDPDVFVDSQKLKALNIRFTEDALSKVDIVVAPRLLRTRKFICSIASAPTAVVHVDWLNAMLKSGERHPPEDYRIHDADEESRQTLKLDEVLERARANKKKGGMLKGWTIFATENVRGGYGSYKDITAANGGNCMLFKGRQLKLGTRSNPRPVLTNGDTNTSGESEHGADADADAEMSGSSNNKSEEQDQEDENENENENDDDDDDDAMDIDEQSSHKGKAKQRENKRSNGHVQKVYLVTDISDKPLWPKFQTMAVEQGFKPMILKPDWLLKIALSQNVHDWSPNFDYLKD